MRPCRGTRRGRGEYSHPETEKFVVEKWCYLPEVYTFGEEAEIIEKFCQKLRKTSIFNRDFYQKLSKFPRIFQKFAPCFFLFAFRWKLFLNVDDLEYFYKLHSIFSYNSNKFHPFTNYHSRCKPFLRGFDRFVYSIIELIGNVSGLRGCCIKVKFLK